MLDLWRPRRAITSAYGTNTGTTMMEFTDKALSSKADDPSLVIPLASFDIWAWLLIEPLPARAHVSRHHACPDHGTPLSKFNKIRRRT